MPIRMLEQMMKAKSKDWKQFEWSFGETGAAFLRGMLGGPEIEMRDAASVADVKRAVEMIEAFVGRLIWHPVDWTAVISDFWAERMCATV